MQAAALFVYGFVSNVALAVLPHEPAVIWYGARLGVWPTALIATAGTLAAALADHRLFVPLIERLARRPAAGSRSRSADPGPAARDLALGLGRLFARAPFTILALSGLTPLPFFPFKALAFATGYPMGRYVAAVAARSLPRYALLAWLGVAVHLPTWLVAGLFLALMIPSIRILPWPRPSAS